MKKIILGKYCYQYKCQCQCQGHLLNMDFEMLNGVGETSERRTDIM